MMTEDDDNKSKKSPPVKVGDTFTIIPNGMAEKDPYYEYDGFIVFIKRMPPSELEKMMMIKITGVKKTFAFAEYRKTMEE
jgi:predicted RNA-binding protein with TRAM domain